MEFIAPDIRLAALLPTILVLATAMVVLLRGVMLGPERPHHAAKIGVVGLLAATVAAAWLLWRGGSTSFGGMLWVDRPAIGFWAVFFLATALALILSGEQLDVPPVERCEAYALLLLAGVGMMFMAASGHLVMIFLGLETMSVALYVLAGLAGPRDRGSNEAALKYLLLGAFATGFLVYGMAFVYGGTGRLDLAGIHAALTYQTATLSFVYIGLGLLLVGLGFKVALVPFHMWAPDVYEGAPTVITAFMSVGPKLAGFAALVRVFDQAALPAQPQWLPIGSLLAVLTMFVGNVVAIAQTNIKRMLAYSSVAHAGYLLVGVLAGTTLGLQGVLFYAAAYALMNLGAFVVVMAVARGDTEGLTLDDYRGLWRRSPQLAAAMALFMFALAGIPPFSGFIGKWLLFAAAVEAGQVPLAVAGVLCSAISAFFYLRVVVLMFMGEGSTAPDPLAGRDRTRAALWATALGTLVLSFPVGLWIAGVAGWLAAGAIG